MKSKILLVLKKELREVFRDRKSLAMMFIIPLMIPFLVIGMSALFESQSKGEVTGYDKIGFTYDVGDTEQKFIHDLKIDATYGTLEEIEKAFQEDEIYLYITREKDIYTLHYDSQSEKGSYTAILANQYLESYKQFLQASLLEKDGYNPEDVFNIIQIEEDIVGQENFYATYIVGYAFIFILMAITVSATYPATDTTAGEKERGTLETLLTFPIKSRDIIIGKLLSVTLSSIITGLLSLLLAALSFYFANQQFEIYKLTPIMLNAASILVTILVIMIYSLFISGICIAIASMSKTFKEAQSALTPVTFISFFPGMIAFMIHVETSSLLSIVPFLNYSLILNDVSNGLTNYLNIFLMVISTLLYISVVVWYIVKQYKSEKILFSI